MKIKLFHKSELIKEFFFHQQEYNNYIINKSLEPGLISIISFIKDLIDIDVNDYVFAKEFRLNGDHIVIILKDADYKKIIRDDKIKNILN